MECQPFQVVISRRVLVILIVYLLLGWQERAVKYRGCLFIFRIRSVLSSRGWKYQHARRIRSTGIEGLQLRLVLFPRSYGPLVVYRIVLTQLPVRSYGIIVITVKVPDNLVRHRRQCLSSGRSLTEALDTEADISLAYSGVNMVTQLIT